MSGAAHRPTAEHDPGAYCANEVRRFDNDRYLTTLFAPARGRRALMALYAFNLEIARVRESVSEVLLGQVRLQFWRDTIAEIYSARPRRHLVALALADAVRGHDLSRDHFEQLIDARAFDLEDEQPASVAELERYAARTTLPLALLALEALNVQVPAVRDAVRHVGIAWALTGLARAVPMHARQGRLYLPHDVMAAAGAGAADILAGHFTPALGVVLETVLRAADSHLAQARAGRRAMPRAALPVLLPAVLCDLYRARLRRVGCNPFDARMRRDGPWRQLALAFHALLGRY